ncbi:VOC family protein [Erythrobacter sp. AP23]|uniref:VOC family protein n=1 Tax=Erythrobacter sp. AP23 TaxID=499656 RepID=UPI00076C937A|nr:VOC family protein [Erythrobacter sp. AP23]KWV93786.1 hypothetical protein ASS64_12895 [Erythrobacter sp. AP23]
MEAVAKGIDHVAVLVADLDKSARHYERLGFNLAPRGHHPQYGTANHTMMFGSDYLELITVEQLRSSNYLIAERLESHEGLWLLALASEDLADAALVLDDRQVSHGGVQQYSRETSDACGSPAPARFATIHLGYHDYPGATVALCQHHTRELVWKPGLADHPNGTVGIAELTLVAKDPAAVAQCYQPILGQPFRNSATDFSYVLGRQTIRVTTHELLRNRIGIDAPHSLPETALAHVALETTELKLVRDCLAQAGVAACESPVGSLIADAALTSGTIIEFREHVPSDRRHRSRQVLAG